MENIKKDLKSYCLDVLVRNSYYWQQALDFFGGNVPQKYVDLYENKQLLSNEFIFETLISHDSEKLKDYLKKQWPEIEFEDYTGDKKKSFYIIIDKNLDYNIGKFKNILSFFNYYISSKEYINDKIVFFIEPRYSDDVTDEVFNNHLYLYHFTDKESAKSILKNGLRCKRGRYREFPERIYMYASKNKIDLNNPEIKNFIDKVVNYNKVKRYGLAILRISNNREIILYKDTAMKNPGAVFAYENIPAEYIKEIKIK